jgi:DNA-binding XRE family transcriptional regulator
MAGDAHGLTRYKHDDPALRCRCGTCQAANTAWQARRSRLIAYGRWEPQVDGTGTRRRLRALMRNGWSLGLLSARLGCDRADLRKRLHASGRVTPATAAAVRVLYDDLWDQPPPGRTRFERAAATKARKYAAARGWPVPCGWDDDEIDDPAAAPVPGWDKAPVGDAIRQAREQAGLSRPQLAALVGVSRSAVQQYEEARCLPGAEIWVQLELTLGPLGIIRPGPGAGQEQQRGEESRDAAA